MHESVHIKQPVKGRQAAEKFSVSAGYPAADSLALGLQTHRLAEAMKHAFALRASLGDPGDCSGDAEPAGCFLNLTSILGDLLSTSFAAELRCTHALLLGSLDSCLMMHAASACTAHHTCLQLLDDRTHS